MWADQLADPETRLGAWERAQRRRDIESLPRPRAHGRFVRALGAHGLGAWWARQRAARAPLPRSVLRCIGGGGTLVHELADGGGLAVVPLACKSWRCPLCGPRVNRRDFLRMRRSLKPLEARSLLFVTVTFYRPRWSGPWAAARAGSSMWRALVKRLGYAVARRVGARALRTRIRWVQVWEQHTRPDSDGRYWLHAHALIESRELAEWVRELGSYDGEDGRRTWRWTPRVFARMARGCGWGRVDAQPVNDKQGIEKYLSKLAWAACEMTGSSAKDQRPTSAPKGFRRIRATPKFLEPVRHASQGLQAAAVAAPLEVVQAVLELGDEHLVESVERIKRTAEYVVRYGWLDVACPEGP